MWTTARTTMASLLQRSTTQSPTLWTTSTDILKVRNLDPEHPSVFEISLPMILFYMNCFRELFLNIKKTPQNHSSPLKCASLKQCVSKKMRRNKKRVWWSVPAKTSILMRSPIMEIIFRRGGSVLWPLGLCGH